MNKQLYFHREYNSERRWMSYWYQINEISKLKPKNVLEIGIGNGLVTWYLRKSGIKVTTCDINKNLKPDITTDIRNLKFRDNEFDFVLCAQVLEHLPFRYFRKVLTNIYRISNKWVLITLPDYSVFDFFFSFKLIPFIPRITKIFRIRFPIKHQYDGNHYWEINKKGFSDKKIKSIFTEMNFKIIKDYNPKENPFHRFFLLKKLIS